MIHIKTQKDIDYIRQSCKLVAEVLQLMKQYVKPGVSTLELDKIAEDYLLSRDAIPAFKGYSQGGTSIDFPGTLCTSVDDEVVHGIPSDRKLKEGEIISIDMGAKKNGYFGDSAITLPVGNIDKQKQRLLEVTEKSLYLGIEQAISSNRLLDISYAIQSYVEENGFSIVRALCGHGVGKRLHEDPMIPNYGRKGNGPKLKSGMTLAIEPMVNIGVYDVFVSRNGWTILTADGKSSAHFEHSIAITDNKPEILTVC